MRTGWLILALLAGCAPRGMTAGEAAEAADREIDRVLPRLDRSGRTIRTVEADGKWRVTYATPGDLNAGGPLIVEVDERTRRAVIVQMAQ